MRTYGFIVMALFLLFIDWYVWTALRHEINRLSRPLLQWVLTALYWLPAVVVVFLVIYTIILVNTGGYRPNSVYMNYVFGILMVTYLSKLLPFLFLFIADVIRLLEFVYRFIVPNSMAESKAITSISRSQFLKGLGWLSGGLVFGSLITGMLKWVYDFQVRKETLKLSKLPKSFEGFKIVQISDMHLGSWLSDKPLRKAVKMINDLQPDVVFFTGDLVNNMSTEAFPFEDALREIKTKYGVFSTLGNHDYGDYIEWPSKEAKRQNLLDLINFHTKLGWTILMNEHRAIEINGEKICILGVENWGGSLNFPRYGRVNDALKNTEEYSVKLLLSHDPSHWDKMIRLQYPDIDATFSGHTHGMQMGIEIPWLKWSPVQYVYRYWAGLYTNENLKDKQQYLYVNRGLGHLGYPGRVGILPEISFFELRA